jgi:hypothetical protein
MTFRLFLLLVVVFAAGFATNWLTRPVPAVERGSQPTHVVVTFPVPGEDRPKSAHLTVLPGGEDAAGRPFWGVSFFQGEKLTTAFRCVAVPHDGIYRTE